MSQHTRNFLPIARYSALAVSLGSRQTAATTAQTLDTSMLWAVSGMPDMVPYEPSDNSNEMTGEMLATKVDRAGHTAEWNLSKDKAEPQHIGLLIANALGSISTTNPSGTAYLHVITPDADTLQLPYFTAAARYGANIFRRQFVGMAVNSFTLDIAPPYVGISGNVLGLGYQNTDRVREVLAGLDNATTLTLAANGITGATAQTRLDNLHQILSTYDAVGDLYVHEVTCSAVSDASPAALTITSPGGAGATISYEIWYVTDTGVAWTTFPAVNDDQNPFAMGNVTVEINGEWDGSAYNGGYELGCEVEGISWTWNNNARVRHCLTGSGSWADQIQRGAPQSSLSMSRVMVDSIMDEIGMNSRITSMCIKVQQDTAITGAYYPYFELVFPRVAVVTNPKTERDGMIGEDVEFAVLSDATYGPVIATIQSTDATLSA